MTLNLLVNNNIFKWLSKAYVFEKILIILFIVSFYLPLLINSRILIFVFVFFVVKKRANGNFIRNPFFLIICTSLIILIFGALRRFSSFQIMHHLELGAFLVGIPIFVYQLRLGFEGSKLLGYFSLANVCLVTLGFIKIFIFSDSNVILKILGQGHTEFTDTIGRIHPTYLSMYFILIAFYSLEELRHGNFSNALKSWLPQMIYLISSVAVLVFLRSQMALMVFTTVVIFYLLVITRKRAWLIAFFLFTVGLLTLLLDSDGTLSQLSYFGKNVSTALDNRVVLWKAVINGLKGNVLFGAGTGAEQTLINEGYRQANFSEGIENSFNAHNQYLQFVCRNGLIELAAFLALLIYCFWKAQHQQNLVFMLFLISFSLLMLTESLLNTQRGIVFFYFFVSVFVFLPYKSDKTVTHPTQDKSII